MRSLHDGACSAHVRPTKIFATGSPLARHYCLLDDHGRYDLKTSHRVASSWRRLHLPRFTSTSTDPYLCSCMTKLSLVHIIEPNPCLTARTADMRPGVGLALRALPPIRACTDDLAATKCYSTCLTKQLNHNEDGQSWPHCHNGDTANCQKQTGDRCGDGSCLQLAPAILYMYTSTAL